MKLKSIFATALVGALAWAGNASAGNLNVAFYNPNIPGTDSYVVDLGVSFDDLASGVNTGFSTNVIETVLADTGVDLGPSISTYEYSVFALGTVTVDEFGGFEQEAVIASSNNPDFAIPVAALLTDVFNNAQTFSDAQDFQNFTSVSEPATPGFFEATSFNGNFGNTTLSAEASVGVSLSALIPEYVGDFEDAILNFDLVNLGDFLLEEDGTFTFSTGPVTVIPVPAAVWLFGTALLGGAARFGRRRNAQAA